MPDFQSVTKAHHMRCAASAFTLFVSAQIWAPDNLPVFEIENIIMFLSDLAMELALNCSDSSQFVRIFNFLEILLTMVNDGDDALRDNILVLMNSLMILVLYSSPFPHKNNSPDIDNAFSFAQQKFDEFVSQYGHVTLLSHDKICDIALQNSYINQGFSYAFKNDAVGHIHFVYICRQLNNSFNALLERYQNSSDTLFFQTPKQKYIFISELLALYNVVCSVSVYDDKICSSYHNIWLDLTNMKRVFLRALTSVIIPTHDWKKCVYAPTAYHDFSHIIRFCTDADDCFVKFKTIECIISLAEAALD